MEPRKPKQVMKDLVCKLTPEEKVGLAEQLTERINRRAYLEDAKKAATKKYSAQIEETVVEINDLSNKIRAGEELRPTPCEIRFDDPAPGYKTMYRLDTGMKISTELMTDADLQGELFPEEEGEEDPEAPETTAPEASAGTDAAPAPDAAPTEVETKEN